MDFGGRVNSKPGAGGLMSKQQEKSHQRERLKKLAMETMDLTKDPYFIVNHHGSYECRLCTTIHKTEGNYLSHTQGTRHQKNLERRALKEQQYATHTVQNQANTVKAKPTPVKRNVIRIGRPGYKCFKSIVNGQKCLGFEVYYNMIEAGVQPRHRFMSAFEQKVEKPDARFQYLLIAADPYETIAFKIPNLPIDRTEGHFSTSWDTEAKIFKLYMMFKENA